MVRTLCLMLGFFAVGLPDQIKAHPHVFVDAQTGFKFDNAGQVVGLKITWTYDAFTSLTLFDILDLDKDGDGFLDDADRAAIVAGETEWAEGYLGDTYLEADGENVLLTRPQNGAAWMSDGQISVSFDLPLAAPLAVEGEVALLLYDPNYYYDYRVVSADPHVPGGCASVLVPFSPDDADAEVQAQLAKLSREEVPDDPNIGRRFADEVRLTCG